jgi:hypothetical protein
VNQIAQYNNFMLSWSLCSNDSLPKDVPIGPYRRKSRPEFCSTRYLVKDADTVVFQSDTEHKKAEVSWCFAWYASLSRSDL